MRTAHLIRQGTTLAVSNDGGDFNPETTQRPLHFDQQDETTDEEMIFSRGPLRDNELRLPEAGIGFDS